MDDAPDPEGRRVYRMSELGGCLKAMAAKKLDYQRIAPPQKMLGKYKEGHAIEPVVLRLLEAAGWLVENRQQEVDIEVTPHVVLRGHIDGTGGPNDTTSMWGVIEVKSMSQGEYDKFVSTGMNTPGLVQKYKWQLSGYMWALAMQAYLVVINRDAEEFDIDDANTMTIIKITDPYLTKGEVVGRVIQADAWYRKGDLPIECDVKSWPCPFVYLHEEVFDPENAEVEALAFAHEEAKKKETVGEDEKKKIRKLLDQATDKKSYNSERVTISYFPVKGREFIDKEAMKADELDPDKYKKRGSGYTGMRITIREVGDDVVRDTESR